MTVKSGKMLDKKHTLTIILINHNKKTIFVQSVHENV